MFISSHRFLSVLSFGLIMACGTEPDFISEELVPEGLTTTEEKTDHKSEDVIPTENDLGTTDPQPTANKENTDEDVQTTAVNVPLTISPHYKTDAEALIAAIDAGTSDEIIMAMASDLTMTGLNALPALIKSHPECTEYLTAITEIGPTLKDLPIAEIESGYHADGKLPKMPAESCYHGKDLVVHPATVAALAKAGLTNAKTKARAKGEIVEVLGHLEAIPALKQP